MPILYDLANYLSPFTLPTFILSNRVLATLVPVTVGSAVGLAVAKVKKSSDVSKTKLQYEGLRRPPLHPPAWIFGPVWTVLYGMMGYASYRVYLQTEWLEDEPKAGLAFYSTSLILNYIWTPLFFGLNLPHIALVDILLLTGNVLAATKCFFESDETAGYLMLPYCAWLCFATYLCAGTGYLNNWDVSLRSSKKEE